MGRQLDDAVKWVVTSDEHDTWISTGPTWDQEHAEESEANARLIAAAPELLSSLRFAVKLLSALPHVNGTVQLDYMRAAIAKATGESA